MVDLAHLPGELVARVDEALHGVRVGSAERHPVHARADRLEFGDDGPGARLRRLVTGPHDARAVQPVEQHVATRRDLVPLEDQHDVEAERRPGRRGHARVVALRGARGDHGACPPRDGPAERVLELPRLVAAAAPADEVVALHQEPLGVQAERLRETGDRVRGGRLGPEAEAFGHGVLLAAGRSAAARRPSRAPWLVREKGLEPSRSKAQEPKSCVSTDSTTPAGARPA